MEPRYEIHVEDGVVCVTKIGDGFVQGFHFDSANSAEDNAQEIYELLACANFEVRME